MKKRLFVGVICLIVATPAPVLARQAFYTCLGHADGTITCESGFSDAPLGGEASFLVKDGVSAVLERRPLGTSTGYALRQSEKAYVIVFEDGKDGLSGNPDEADAR